MVRQLDEVQKDLAKNMREARLKAGLSQESLALAADVDRTYVSQIERYIGNPSIHVIIKLAKVLGVDICELLKHSNFSE
jgi:transcriptional regulator with XRE-family HTH domain